MKTKEKKKIMNIVWLVTDVIIIICALLLFLEGGTIDKLLGLVGVVLVIVEVILYKKGYILQ